MDLPELMKRIDELVRSPRRRRVLKALVTDKVKREELDRIAGSSNSPDVCMRLRRQFGEDAIDCEMVPGFDVDGRACTAGVYSLTDVGRRRLHELLEPEMA